jgi:hypothetical protein
MAIQQIANTDIQLGQSFPISVVNSGASSLLLQTANTTAVTIDSSQNVSITNGATSSTLFNNRVLRLATNASGADCTLQFTDSVAYNAYIGMASGALNFAPNTGTVAMTLGATGNVGIGITPVSQKLEVKGNQRLVGDSAYILWRDTADSASSGVIQFPSASVATIGTYVNQAMLFQTNNTERMRIDTSGNVGIGTSSPAYKLDVVSSSDADLFRIKSTATANNTVLRLGLSGNNAVISGSGDSTGTLQFNVYGSERMRLDSSGNLGIGTSSPAGRLDSYGDGTNPAGIFRRGGAYGNIESSDAARSNRWTLGRDNASTGNFVIAYNDATKASMDTSGNLLVGTTTQYGLITTAADLASKNTAAFQNTGTTYGAGAFFVRFVNSSAATAGSIQHTAVTTVNYGTSSDSRLKESLGVATDTSVIDNTIIHDFTWKYDGRVDRGVFAQEAHLIKPSAVGVGSDELTEDGSLENPWSVDYSKYVPDLIVHAQQLKKKIQELKAINDTQAETINALTARIVALETK